MLENGVRREPNLTSKEKLLAGQYKKNFSQWVKSKKGAFILNSDSFNIKRSFVKYIRDKHFSEISNLYVFERRIAPGKYVLELYDKNDKKIVQDLK